MKMSGDLIIEDGKIALPDDVLSRYGLAENAPVRIIETRTGILIVPLTDEPMSETLAAELEQWQALGAETLSAFPYDEDKQA